MNAFTAEVLAACDPTVAKWLAQLVAEKGAARLWVPASQSRAAAFARGRTCAGLVTAGAHRRKLRPRIAGQGGLRAALDLEHPRIAAEVCEGTRSPTVDAPLADGTVAVFNRGTLGAAVTPDGTLWMSLFRACSGWPSGVWIDGDRRTAPDGSSFAWQHWSHTFEYALASSGASTDWRSAGSTRRRGLQPRSHHDRDGGADADPASVSFADVSLAGVSLNGAPNVTLSALKPSATRSRPACRKLRPVSGVR